MSCSGHLFVGSASHGQGSTRDKPDTLTEGVPRPIITSLQITVSPDYRRAGMLLPTGCVVFFYWITVVAGLWPLPRYFEHGSSTVWLSPDVQLFIVNENVGFPDYGWAWSRIQWIM